MGIHVDADFITAGVGEIRAEAGDAFTVDYRREEPPRWSVGFLNKYFGGAGGWVAITGDGTYTLSCTEGDIKVDVVMAGLPASDDTGTARIVPARGLGQAYMMRL